MSPARPRVAVVGAGLAGAACARRLSDAGADVHLFEKSRGVGGRMATRRARWTDAAGVGHDAAFDHGAPGFSAHGAAFAEVVERHARAGELQRWTPRMAPGGAVPLDGVDTWIAVPDMPTLCRRLVDTLPIRVGDAVEAIVPGPDGWRLEGAGETLGAGFSHVVLAMPPAQAAALLEAHRPDWAQSARRHRMLPCWTLMAVAVEAEDPPAWDAAWPADGPLAWIIRDDRKPGRRPAHGFARYVAHARAAWSDLHLEAPPDTVHAALLSAVADFLGQVPAWRFSRLHRWRYASATRLDAWAPQPFRFDAQQGIGVCGDYLGGAGVEGAWTSGDALAACIALDCGLAPDAHRRACESPP